MGETSFFIVERKRPWNEMTVVGSQLKNEKFISGFSSTTRRALVFLELTEGIGENLDVSVTINFHLHNKPTYFSPQPPFRNKTKKVGLSPQHCYGGVGLQFCGAEVMPKNQIQYPNKRNVTMINTH